MNRLARYIIICLSIAAIGFVLWYFSAIVWYILISMVLSLMGKPIVQLVCRAHVRNWYAPTWLGATVALVSIWLIFAAFFWGMIPLLAEQLSLLGSLDATEITTRFAGPIAVLDGLVARFLPDGAPQFSTARELQNQLGSVVNVASVKSLFTSTATAVMDLLIALFSISFITFFFLKEERLFAEGFSSFFPARYQTNLSHALRRVNALLRRYFVGILLESVAIMVATFLGLLALGLPIKMSLVLGLLSGTLNVVPYVGALIALGVSLVAPSLLYVHGGLSLDLGTVMVLISLLFLAIRFLDNFFLQPLIYSSSAHAHPLEIFLVILFAGSLAGVLGMLLAIPAYTVLRVFAKEFFNHVYLVQRLTKNI